MTRLLAAVVVLAGPAICAAQANDKAALVTDFSSDLATGRDDAQIVLQFTGVRPLKGMKAGDIAVTLQRRGGQVAAAGHRAAADYNQVSPGQSLVKELRIEGNDITGTLEVTIGPDRPRPNGPPGFPNPPDHFELTFTARMQPRQPLPYQADAESFMPPWRKDMPRFGGDAIEGTYKGTLGSRKAGDEKRTNVQPVEGKLIGAINAAPVAGRFGAQGNVYFTAGKDGGVAVLARLAPKRVAPPEGCRIVKELAGPADWRGYTGLRLTVSSPKRRDDAAVALGIRESEGAWYTVTAAGPLLGREATFTVPFSDFRRSGGFDANYFLDLDKVTAISLGVDSASGVGDVEFAVKRVELYRDATPAPQRIVSVKVDPSTVVSFNGTSEIPKGLFGFHDVNPPRANTAPSATQPTPVEYMKQLNPGYLRPLDHVSFGGKPISDEQIKAAVAERLKDKSRPDGTMYLRAEAGNCVENMVWCHTVNLWSRPYWMDQDMGRVLEGVKAFYREQAARAWVPGDDHNLLRRFEVWNEPFMWGRHMNKGDKTPAGEKRWDDPTQYGYLPGKLGADVYSDIFLAAVEGAKGANPHVQLGGMSTPAFNDDDYGCFENYIRHFIDRCHEKIDFLTEHHYQGLPDAHAASYQVAAAYTDVKYAKRFPVYNTECNDLVDTPTKGDDGQPPPWHLKADQLNRAHYNIQDILACILVCPDIAKGRAMHALWSGYCRNPGETHAYTVMSQLRGQILAAECSDPAIMAVAASRPGKVVAFVFNNSPEERIVTLSTAAGFRPESFQQLVFEDGTKLIEQPMVAVGVDLPEGAVAFRLPGRSAARYTLAKAGYAPTQTRKVEQSFCDAVLARVQPRKPVTAKVLWRGDGPAGAKSATLRVITRGVARGQGVALINGKAIPLPWSSSNDGCAVAQDVALDPSVLKPQTTIEFRCADPEMSSGFTVYAASINVER